MKTTMEMETSLVDLGARSLALDQNWNEKKAKISCEESRRVASDALNDWPESATTNLYR